MCKKKTTEEFIEDARKVHGDKYDYSLVEYKKSKEKVIVICSIHSNFELTPNSHLKGNGCKSCGVEARASKQRGNEELFLKKAKEAHGDKYDYSKVNYFNSLTEVEIICSTHGSFLQTPKTHYKSGCSKCTWDRISKLYSKGSEKFIEEVIERYGDVYDFSLLEYVNTKTPVKLIHKEFGLVEARPDCLLDKSIYVHKAKKKTKSNDKGIFIQEATKVYGDKHDYTDTKITSSKEKIEVRCKKHDHKFELTIHNYLGGQQCPKCSAENYRELRAMPKEEYYTKANEKHDNKYTYIDDYTTLKGVVTFICEEHGKQRKNAGSHLNGYGCKKCDIEPLKINKRSKGGYCKLADGRDTTLYVIRCYDENEEFYKIGKTFRKITKRFISSNMPYNIEVIYKYKNSADFIWDLEEELHKKHKGYRYNPRQWFAGYSESYKLNLPIEQIIKEVQTCQKE